MRSIRRGSTSATTGSSAPQTTTALPLVRASGSAASITRDTTSRISAGSASRIAAPASKRLISSRSASRDSNRSSWFCSSSAERSAAGSPKSSRDSYSRSAAIRTVVSGVRSSCETSETKRRWTRESSSSWRIWVCRADPIRLKDSASRAMSSVPETFIRSSSRPSASRSEISAAMRTGVTTCRTTSQEIAPSSSTTNRPAVASVLVTRLRVFDSSVNGNR